MATRPENEKQWLTWLDSAIEQAYRAVLIITPELDPPGPQIVYVSAGIAHMTGYRDQDIIGKSLCILQGPGSDRGVLVDLRRRLRDKDSAQGESLICRKDGSQFIAQWQIDPLRDHQGVTTHRVVALRDIEQSQRASKMRRTTQRFAHRMARLATHDRLTGLVNRSEFERRLAQALTSAKVHGTHHALCYIDLDQFKIVNDSVGHAAGDQLLKQVADVLLGTARAGDTFARLGGDEFGLLSEYCTLDEAIASAKAVVATIRDYRFSWGDRLFEIGTSIGVVPITSEAESTDELMSRADIACYIAKDRGRHQVYAFRVEDRESLRHRTEIFRAAELTDALAHERFELYAQPIVSLSPDTEMPENFELLLRLVDETGAVLLPGAFIRAAERYGLMATIDRWVIKTAFKRYAEAFGSNSRASISINLSGGTLSDGTLVQFVRETLAQSTIPPDRVWFEITETAAIRNLKQASQFMTEIKRDGCRFALDDFGSGLSSFTYLKALPLDSLKIDGSFVQEMDNNPVDHAVVAAINQVGHIMGIQTVAECAGTNAILELLWELGVDYAQGYAVAPPKPLTEMSSQTGSAQGAKPAA